MNNEDVKEVRIHIGNISPKLAENEQSLSTRLSKFGKVVKPLELHTKPIQDFYFGFITLELSSSGFEKLKTAFNGILFMGMKLTIGIAKQNFPEAWKQDSERPDVLKFDRIKRDRIQRARADRINEAKTPYFVNSENGSVVTHTYNIGTNDAIGYSKSSHTFNNLSGNIKQAAPNQLLIGKNSYSTDTVLKKPTGQVYSRTSGRGELIKGRHRITKRPHIHFLKGQQTLRILINGELKQIQGFKTKLWGMEKHKTARDLTWRYHNGTWRSGDDHIIEKNESVKLRDPIIGGPQPVKCGIDGEMAENYGANIDIDSEEGEITEERNKNNTILASLFSSYDFDKPMDVSDLEDNGEEQDIVYDSKGRRKVKAYDYEIEGRQDDDAADEMSYNIDSEKAKELINTYKETIERPKEEVYYDEDDEGNELDLDELGRQYTTEAIREKYDEEHGFEVVKNNYDPIESTNENNEESLDDSEFIPSFGNNQQPEVNNTDTLRTLFNPNQEIVEEKEEPLFKLALSEDDDDIDEEKTVDVSQQKELLEKIKMKQQQEDEEIQSSKEKKFGLFWSHKDSPFLQSQSQLNKVGGLEDVVKLPGETDSISLNAEGESPYEQWFWQMRGELSRECKRRKRDVLRIFKKKTNKNPVI